MTGANDDKCLLSVRGLTLRSAKGLTLVRDVSLRLAAGETLGIVGESGSGKTMTARAISRVLAPGLSEVGSIEFDGGELTGLSERRLRPLRGTRISMVLQDPFTALNPLQTIRETLRESLPRSRRTARARSGDNATAGDREAVGDREAFGAAINRRLAEVGLDPAAVAGKYPFQLSGGMRQRVAIAAALAGDPDLLIADEPTTALDVTTQAEILGLLRKLQRERGMALILITHDLRVAFSVCDRVLVMYAGSVMECGPADGLASAPLHPYTAGLLLAEPPVSHYVDRLVTIPGRVPAADAVAGHCAFADRCAWVVPECTVSRPELTAVAPGHDSACRRIADIGEELRPGSAPSAPALTTQREGTQAAPAQRDALLQISDLTKTYRTTRMVGRAQTTTAVAGVSLRIEHGESLGLVGETGSGKTTIARCVVGLATASSGAINLAGFDVSDYRKLSRRDYQAVRRLVQVVFQDPYSSLNPSLTIGATLKEAVAARGDAAVRRARGTSSSRGTSGEVAELLGLVGLPESYASARPSALSGGERQRAAIARAVAMRPKLLICDEPVAALDVSVQAQVLAVLRGVRAAYGVSMLFITHDLAVVRQMTERAIVLWQGKIVEEGATATVLDEPKHPYTARLVESVPRPEGPSRSQPSRS
jgi:oligopeptide/dipeptide ABC transporter ATP-binding protein